MKTDVRVTSFRHLLLPFLAVLFLLFVFSGTGLAQGAEPPAQVETGGLAIEENPIYLRLIEIVNFLSIGVTIVVAISIAVSGFQYMMSRGDPGTTSAAIQRMVQAGTALVLYIFGWSLLNWLVPGGILN